MTTYCMGAIAIVLGFSLLVTIALFACAPHGYEDKDGFHKCRHHPSTRREN